MSPGNASFDDRAGVGSVGCDLVARSLATRRTGHAESKLGTARAFGFDAARDGVPNAFLLSSFIHTGFSAMMLNAVFGSLVEDA
jgi:hypothetical protein